MYDSHGPLAIWSVDDDVLGTRSGQTAGAPVEIPTLKH